MTAPVVEVQLVKKAFGETPVLRGVSLAVHAGEAAVLVGPSGSGKSTALRCINGLAPFDEGTIRVGDRDIPPNVSSRRDAPLLQKLRRSAGMVFQALHLFPHLSVIDNLTEAPVRVLGDDRDKAEVEGRKLLERVGLDGFERRMPRELSGGQQQRVAIARALLMRPSVLLFDEPTSALDPGAAADVLEVMNDLAKDGQTMIVVTHAYRFARRAATHVHVSAGGLVVESGGPDQIFDQPEHQITRRLLEAERT